MRIEPIPRTAHRHVGALARGAGLACLMLAITPALGVPTSPAEAGAAGAGTVPAHPVAKPANAAQAQAQASDPVVQPSPTAQALTSLEEETLVLKARLKALETETQIAQRSAELVNLTAASAHGDLAVHGVEGIGNKLYATLWSRDAGEFEVKAGDTLPNGMHIVSIRPEAVLAQPARGGKPVALPMDIGSQAPQAAHAAAPISGTGLPGVPPLPR